MVENGSTPYCKSNRIQDYLSTKRSLAYIFPLRSRLNNLPEDPDAAADAAENDANDPDDNAFSPGVPAFEVP